MKKLLLGIAALSALWLTGCASIVDGNNQSVSFASNPDGATVYLNGAAIGKTPMTINTKRKGGTQPVKFSKEGYKDVEVQLTSTINPWFFGNIITGGLLGSTTDGLSGAAFKYAPGAYMVTLPPAEAATSDSTSLHDKQQVVNFIVAGYQGLQKDLSAQGGQYLTSLMTLAKVADTQQAEMAKRIKGLADAYPSIPEFADKAADALLAKP
ncbi:MAG TPA: PEGA domain-containing protein [Moraxellaceae bacterium]|nr:PEGA domain-containing protein [Moraxellaceae bacterium]